MRSYVVKRRIDKAYFIYPSFLTYIKSLIRYLEVPWQKPWVNGNSAVNWKTQKQYRGINTMLLDPSEYVTFKQAQKNIHKKNLWQRLERAC